MKKLFFVLLVLNLVLWLWGKRQELAPVAVPAEPGIGVIRLLEGEEIEVRRREAVSAAAPEAAASPPDAVALSSTAVVPPAREADIAKTRPADEGADGPAVGPPEPAPDGAAGAEKPTAAVAPALPPVEAQAPTETEAAGDASIAGADTSPAGPATEIDGAAESMADRQPLVSAVTAEGPPEPGPKSGAAPRGPEPAPPVCESTGPFRDRATAERYAATLEAPISGASPREEVITKAGRYWVLAPAARDADPAYRQALGEAGIHDAWRVRSGPLAGRLSLGAFQVEDNARKQVATLAAKGIATELQALREQDRRWWVDYERPFGTPAPAVAALRGEAPRQVVERRCGLVAAP